MAMDFEDTQLYQLLASGSRNSMRRAYDVIDAMTEEEVRQRSEKDRSTFLHVLIAFSSRIRERNGSFTPLIPLIYKLALKRVNMNAQNAHGNTCLHVACLKPNTESLCEHLIRIGTDPCIMNKKGCRVIHTVQEHRCHIVKGQSKAKSGIWSAVEKEDMPLLERLLRSWCRVNIRKNKSLTDVADETGNVHLTKLLNKYEKTNEVACAAYAGNLALMKELVRTGGVDLQQHDESQHPPQPLYSAINDVSEHAEEVLQYLQDMDAGPEKYEAALQRRLGAFEDCDFYTLVEKCTEESLTEALDLVKSLDLTLRSNRTGRTGWNYMHYLVDRYNRIIDEDEYMARVLVRVIYRLALAGIDMNDRDEQSRTPLMIASDKLNQAIMTHIVRLGGDPSLKAPDGRTVSEEVYEDKGKLVYGKKYRQADLPGLWVAVETNDTRKTERWLKSCARVNVKKGDRRLIEISRDMGRTEITELLEKPEHVNEFVCATLACDLKLMMHLLALGRGHEKVNTIDDFFHIGFTMDRHAEFMPRPIVISAMEICGPDVVDFLLQYGADLGREHEESFPCGPAMFWAFRHHVDYHNSMVVARHADVTLQDELGCTMLHKAVQKKGVAGKAELIQVLLDRGVNIAARDHEGCTARDYISIHDVENGADIAQIIDNHVLELVSNDHTYLIENLIIENYDHITDIRSAKKNKSLLEIAEMKELKETTALLSEHDEYKQSIELLHEATRVGDLRTISKLAGEKRCAWSKDRAGRTLLHNAVLFNHPDIVSFLVDQHPNLINSRDNLLRTPLHYCVCLEERQNIWPTLQDGGSDPNICDVNHLSVYDYVRELETPTPVKDKPRGRRVRNYKPSEMIEYERSLQLGSKLASSRIFKQLKNNIGTASISEIYDIIGDFTGTLTGDLDVALLKSAVDKGRTEVAKILIDRLNARPDAQILTDEGTAVSLVDYAVEKNMDDFVEFIKDKLEVSE